MGDFQATHFDPRRVIFIRPVTQIALDPAFSWPYTPLGLAYLNKGMLPEAIAAFEGYPRSAGKPLPDSGFLGFAYARASRIKEAQDLLGRLLELERQGRNVRLEIAYVQHGLGNEEAALALLNKLVDEHEIVFGGFMWALWLFEDIRPLPGFQSVLKRLNLPR